PRPRHPVPTRRSSDLIRRKSDKVFIVRRNLPPIHEVIEATPFDSDWDRTFTYRSDASRVSVPQHLSELTPSHARLDATGKYFWRDRKSTRLNSSHVKI